jgi:hypothetical protein
MPDHGLRFDPEALLSQSRWVIALARQLVEDRSLADDVAQEVWLSALRRPPHNLAKVRAWVAAVIANLARDLRVGRLRREHRERVFAPQEQLPSAADIVDLGGDGDGVLEIRDELPVYVSAVMRHVVLVTERVDAPVPELRLVIDPAMLSSRLATFAARIADAQTGEGLSAAQLGLSSTSLACAGRQAASDGSFRLEGLPPGLLSLCVFCPGHERIMQYVKLEPGEVLDLGTLRLQPATEISGTIVDPEGISPDHHLTCRSLEAISFPQPLDLPYAYRADAGGRFSIFDAGRGRHVVIVQAPDRAIASVVADTSAGPVRDLRIVLTAGTTVTLEPAVDPGTLLALQDANGTPVWSSLLDDDDPIRLRLAPGRYSLAIHDPGGSVANRTMEVGVGPLRFAVER